MTDPYVEDEINLRDYWRVLVRRRFLILGITFVTTISAAIFVFLQPNIYRSTTTLLPLGKTTDGLSSALGRLEGFLPSLSLSGGSSKERILSILQSRTLAEDVVRRLDLLPILFAKLWDADKQQWKTDKPPTVHDAAQVLLGKWVSITSDRKTGGIVIEVEHTDPELTTTIANQYIDTLQDSLNKNAFSLAKKHRLFIESQLKKAKRTLSAAEEALRNFEQKHGIVSLDAQTAASIFSLNQAPEVKLNYARLRREAVLQDKVFTLLVTQLEQAKIEEARDETSFQVLDRAILPKGYVKPKRRRIVILSLVVGAFLGVLVAFFQEYMDDKVRSRDQVERQIGIQVLATIPSPKLPKRRFRRRRATSLGSTLVLNHAHETSLIEAYRYLHTRLKNVNDGSSVNALLFTGVEPNDTILTTLANLAITAAGSGEKTLLIDSNVRQPALHRLLDCPAAPGLAEAINDPEGWQKCMHPTSVANLTLLPAGITSPTIAMSSPLDSSAFDALLAQCKERYDLVLVLAASVLDFSDAVTLGSKVDATCLVLDRGVTRLEAIEEASAALKGGRVKVAGAILVAG